jgi:WD40 repeat protein/tetratricopeptide (TPR) repeat protein
MRSRLVGALLACAAITFLAAGTARADDVAAAQVRFFPATVQAVDVELSRFGTFLALADGTEGNSVRVLDASGELLWRHRQYAYWGGTWKHPGILAFAPDDSFLLYPAYRTDGDIAVVNPRTGEPVAVLLGHGDYVTCFALSPDASRLVSSAGRELFLWTRDGPGFALAAKMEGRESTVRSIAFSPDGRLVAMSEYQDRQRRIAFYRLADNRLVPVGKIENEEANLGHEFAQLAFSPDGQWLAAGYSDTLKILRRSGEGFTLAQEVPGIELGAVESAVFSPDGALLFTGHNREIRQWRLVNGAWKPGMTFNPHHGWIEDMEISVDGARLAIAGHGDTNALGLWSLKGVGPSPTGALLALLSNQVSAAQRRFLDDETAARILAALPAEDMAPRDMFETEEEYAARRAGVRAPAAALLQEETEKRFSAERAPLKGALYEVSVPLQAQGTYDIDTRTYTLRFMDTEATTRLERDQARELYRGWQKARVRAVRLQTSQGTTYADFRVALPVTAVQVPLGLAENPFTGEKLDRFGARVPSVSVGPDLLLRDLAIQGIFPALYRFYGEHALGQVTLQNTGSAPITGLTVRLYVPGLMKTPTDAACPPVLGVGQGATVDIRALLDAAVLDRGEGASVPAELTVEYTSQGKPWKETVSRPIGILNRNAMRWTDDRKVGAFMTVSDPSFLRFSGQVMGMVDDTTTSVVTRGFLSAVRMFSAMKAAGVRYVVDPSSAYESLSRDATAIDYVRFPSETLDAKSGDCDDLSVLYASLLESVGVPTACITTPGHIFAAFDVGLAPEAAARLFAKAEDLIVRDDTAWVPVETTLLDQGFVKAWQTAAVEWREAKAAGTAGFFTTKEAWQMYAPAGFAGSPSVAVPSREKVVAYFNTELDAWRAAALGPREKDLLGQIEQDPTPARENQLGVLYAQFGLLSKALGRFESAVTRGGYLPAMVNAANIYSLKQDYARAQEYLRRAQQKEPDNARVLIALGISLFQSGNELDAKSAWERGRRIDPALASRYPLAGSAAGGQGRAGATDPKALFGTDWVQ